MPAKEGLGDNRESLCFAFLLGGGGVLAFTFNMARACVNPHMDSEGKAFMDEILHQLMGVLKTMGFLSCQAKDFARMHRKRNWTGGPRMTAVFPNTPVYFHH